MKEEISESIDESKTKFVDINPLPKGKRILAFLGDFFLIFIISFALYNIAVNPIANAITSKDSRAEEALKANHSRDDILYGNKILYYENEGSKYNFSSNLTYTFNRYISYYGFSEGETYSKDSNIGCIKDNEIFVHYYGDIRSNLQTYIDLLKKENNSYDYFVIDNNKISLKETIKNEVKLSFTSPEDMSEDGNTQYTNLQTIFLDIYQNMFNDVSANDLSYEGNKYSDFQSKVIDYNYYYNNMCTISSIITYVVSFIIIYLVFPLINKNRRTPTMAILKIDRIGTNNLFVIKRIEVLINAVYSLFFNAANLIFIPMTTIGFEATFGLPYILIFSIIGLLLTIVSLFTIVISSYNRSLIDFFSRSVLIKEEDLDRIYQARGYEL